MANDIRLVEKYMFQFDYGVPIYVILALLIITTGIIVGLYLTRKDRSSFIRHSLLCLLVSYLIFILCTTLIFRENSETMRYHLFPFWSYDVLNYKVIAEHILNVLMFVPIGFLLGATVIEIRFWQLIKIGCMISVTIEVIQLLSHRGVCNIDDVIHNTIGCAIGYGAFRLCYSILKNI